jgi:DNA polymerase-3 subunit gamma/tau
MPYEITATRKRPQSFEELAGQEFVSATLEASLSNGRIAHAYLFSGPRGCGKTSTARILAKALNCEKGPTAKPCGTCRSCVEIARGASLDVIEIDGASNTSVDNVRQIKDEVLFPPNGGRYKVYIIDEVHMLSTSAFNALLKTIEEPPPYIVFIFATTELHKVPATIKSRCQQFAFRLIPTETVKSLLASAAAELGIEAEDEALLWMAKESGGSLRDAYTLFDQVVSFSEGKLSAALIRDKLGLVGLDAMNGLFRSCVSGDAAAALSALDEILARGVSAEQFAVDATEYCRSLLLLAQGIEKASLLGAPASAYDSDVRAALSREQLERALAGLLELYRNLRFTVDPRFELELGVSKLCRLKDYVSPGELATVVAALRRKIGGGDARLEDKGAGDRPRPDRSVPGSAGGAEKKKPELPPSLSAAFGSLAAAAKELGEEGAVAAAVPDAAPPPSAPAPRPPAVEEQEGEDEEEIWAPAAAPEQAQPAAQLSEGDALRAAVIEAIGKASPLLKTGLSSSLPWRLEDGRLVLPFRSGMDESVVRGSIADIAAAASRFSGKQLKVELKVEAAAGRGKAAARIDGAEAAAAGESNPVTIVERVFRGSRVAPEERGS